MRRPEVPELIENILRLRRAERSSEQPARAEIALARELLEELVGPTVKPAEAARLLGVSRPAMKRWLDKREIAAVTTPGGRREIPRPELVELLEEVDEVRQNGKGRPLASVIRERRRRSAETIDVDRLLPRRRARGHRTAELHALAYHRAVAERLDDGIVDEARSRLRRWRDAERIDPRWADAWERILELPLPKIAQAISADSARGRALRQTSPLAGVLTEQERGRLARAVEERAGT